MLSVGKLHNLCQSRAMRIVCPECHAVYKLGAIIKNAILVCHRCNTEFDTYGHRITDGSQTAAIFKKQEEHAPTFGIQDLAQSGMNNQRKSILSWMILVLILLSVAGIAVQWQHWQWHGLTRAINLETDNTQLILDRDWHILPETVRSQWLTRDDQSTVLIVSGEVASLVYTAMPVPDIKITFMTQTGENQEVIQAITEPADMPTLSSAPFISPPVDIIPIPALGQRGFLLLIENVPMYTQHMILHAIAVQHHQTP